MSYLWKTYLLGLRRSILDKGAGVFLLCLIVRGYQLFVSPVLGPACRFTPSCSQYAMEAIRRYGATKGAALSVKRVLRCHPWCAGGFDPVP